MSAYTIAKQRADNITLLYDVEIRDKDNLVSNMKDLIINLNIIYYKSNLINNIVVDDRKRTFFHKETYICRVRYYFYT